MQKVTFRAEIFKEDNVFVALAPELNVSSFGESIEEARQSLNEAIEAFVEECEDMGTLEDVMAEAGFSLVRDTWTPRKPVAQEILSVG